MLREELEGRVGAALLHMIRRAEESQERAARQHEMHPTDFRCLGYLDQRDAPVSPGEIITHLHLTSGSGTALLDRLEKAGYARRERNPEDRRSVLVVLDRNAAAEPLAVHRRIREEYQAATADLTDADLLAVATYLERVQELSEAMNQELYLQADNEAALPI
jgi:DNA-binding MarR family transcriptional regulator